MNNVPVMTAKVPGTDKMRIRFYRLPLTDKMQDAIVNFFELKWRRDVVVVRWPRSNVVEVRLSFQMIRSAGFLEVTQEVRRYWQAFLRLVQNEIELMKTLRGQRP